VYGDFERRRGDLEAARRLYQTAIDIDPHYEQAYVVMGMLELAQGNKAGADDVVAASKAVFGADYDFASLSDQLAGAFDRNELGEL
jgi:tetratricopeptide (TPR) repeat protein